MNKTTISTTAGAFVLAAGALLPVSAAHATTVPRPGAPATTDPGGGNPGEPGGETPGGGDTGGPGGGAPDSGSPTDGGSPTEGFSVMADFTSEFFFLQAFARSSSDAL